MIKAIARVCAFGLSLTAFAGTGSAAPRPAKPEADPPAIQTVAYKCWWKAGVRHCARDKYVRRGRDQEQPIYYFSSPPELAEAYRTGSREWWQAMDRDRRGGFPDN